MIPTAVALRKALESVLDIDRASQSQARTQVATDQDVFGCVVRWRIIS
jgi:hypothetical protein